jgi:selenium metabolism protein YedF
VVKDDLLLVIKSSVLGDGEPDLGEKLIHSFLTQLLELGEIPARIICMNSGVFLTTTENTPVLALMRRFAEAGTEIHSCGTCLAYYGREDRLLVGTRGNMTDTVRAMLDFPRVLQV